MVKAPLMSHMLFTYIHQPGFAPHLCDIKVVAAAAQAAKATAPPPPKQQQAQESRVTVAMDPSVLLHQHGSSLGRLSDPSSVVAQAAQATVAEFDSMTHASDDDVAI